LIGIVVAWVSPDRAIGSAERLMHVVRGLGVRGAVVFVIIQILVAVSGILPASLLGVAAGAICGLVPGFLLAAAEYIGRRLISFFSRYLFRGTIWASAVVGPGCATSMPRLRAIVGSWCPCCESPRLWRSLLRASRLAYPLSAYATMP
jgi:hypothetical protein